MNRSTDPRLKAIHYRSTDDTATYELVITDESHVYISSTKFTRILLNDPRLVGLALRRHLSSAVRSAIHAVIESGEPAGRSIVGRPLDAVCILRGGLNFDPADALSDLGPTPPSVSFISAQRTTVDGVSKASDLGYQRWAIRDQSVVCIADISASGITIARVLEELRVACDSVGCLPGAIVVVTIGTVTSLESWIRVVNRLKRHWSSAIDFTIIFLEGVFGLFEQVPPALQALHHPKTDFVRRGALQTPEFELASFGTPTFALDRCLIYDGGERGFESEVHQRRMVEYWTGLMAVGPSVEDVLLAKTDWLDHEDSFETWRGKRSYWSDAIGEDTQRNIHEIGASAVAALRSQTLSAICKMHLAGL